MAEHIVLGLGNPGPEYAATRHNAGWMVLDELARRAGVRFSDDPGLSSLVAEMPGGVVLAKPLTYMNRSGLALGALLDRFGKTPAAVLVIVDDMALPAGRIRFRDRGASGGHNGLKSIAACLGTDVYARLRLGIGSAAEGAIDHVLGVFSVEEQPLVTAMVARAADGVTDWVTHGLAWCQNVYNPDARPDATGTAGVESGAGGQTNDKPVQEE